MSKSIITPKLLDEVGTALYGDRWQNQVAHAVDYSQGLLSMMVGGQRPIVNRALLERIAKLCTKRASDLNIYAEILNDALHRHSLNIEEIRHSLKKKGNV